MPTTCDHAITKPKAKMFKWSWYTKMNLISNAVYIQTSLSTKHKKNNSKGVMCTDNSTPDWLHNSGDQGSR